MKTLTLLRHAKSDWSDPIARDFDRPLNGRGRRAARTVGRAMRDEGLHFDQVIASPAVRVIETLADVEDGFGAPIRPVYDERLYLASVATLMDAIHAADAETESLLLVGHNPGLEALTLFLTEGETSGMRSDVEVKYPTATIAEIALAVDHWSDVEAGSGRLRRFIRPRDLDPSLGPDSTS